MNKYVERAPRATMFYAFGKILKFITLNRYGENSWACITGASDGVGLAVAHLVAHAQHHDQHHHLDHLHPHHRHLILILRITKKKIFFFVKNAMPGCQTRGECGAGGKEQGDIMQSLYNS